MIYIYGLTDPDGTIRYVGQSKDPVARLGSHMKEPGSQPMREWIAKRGVPGLVILSVASDDDAAAAEREWINRYCPNGLVNIAMNCPAHECGGSRGSREFSAAVSGMGTSEAARRLGVVPSMVSHLKAGQKRPSLALAVRIAAVLGVQPEAWEDAADAPSPGDAA